MAEPLLRIDGLSYRYPEAERDSLDDIDLELDGGEFVVLAGRSGSGKSTLLRAACGLVPHFYGGEIEGRVELAGIDTRESGPAELSAEVGFVSQDPETQAVSTRVGSEIGLPLELRGQPAAARARAVEEVALALAIPHLLERPIDTLSGGELQRVAIAAALAPRPSLILLDEPTSQLDPVAGDELIWLLRRLNEEWGVAVLLCEHRLERCLAAADRVVAMKGGAIGFDGAPGSFLDWALGVDPPLATPVARLFDLAGIRPLPVGVRAARELLNEGEGGGDRQLTGDGATHESMAKGGGRRPQATWPPGTTDGGGSTNRAGAGGRAGSLRTRNLWVELDAGEGPREVLRGLELEFRGGETVALMGRNGAGKTTLLRVLARLIEPQRGRVDAPGGVALLPQNPGDLLVRERISDELPGDGGRRALAAVGLEWAIAADPRDLSGGERQRLALAIVMGGRSDAGGLPGGVLMDEPTRGMDRSHKDDLAALARALAKRGAAVVIATHDVEFASGFADRVVLLGQGEVIAEGPAAELLSGGWYFASEVARVLGLAGVITAEQGAEALKMSTAHRAEIEVSSQA